MSTDNIGGIAAATLDKYGEEDFFAVIVRYGLLMGAVFQFVCISAAVLMSGNDSQDTIEEETRLTDEPVQGSGNAARRLHKIRKLEKKKRR